jgi:hypothetical protein
VHKRKSEVQRHFKNSRAQINVHASLILSTFLGQENFWKASNQDEVIGGRNILKQGLFIWIGFSWLFGGFSCHDKPLDSTTQGNDTSAHLISLFGSLN